MTTYEKWIDYVSGALVAFAAVVSFIVGDWLGGMLFTAVLLGQIVNHVQKRQIAELREDLAAALKREREHINRYARAEAKVAYHEHLRKQRRDALVDELDEPLKSDLRETFANLDAIRGDAE